MRWSQYYLFTTREVPSDAEVVSHQLMVRTGMIKKVAAGIYTYLPFGWRSLAKLMAIVRGEMNAAGALEVQMPAIQPAEPWQESGRWQKYGRELLRIKDRHERDFVFGPTHEEVITDVVRRDVKSYRQLPFNLYQIQTKFRDLYRQLLEKGVEVFYDDRDERPGVKFKDADLIGLPIRVVVGARSPKDGQVEVSLRRDRQKQLVRTGDAVARVMELGAGAAGRG